MDFAHKFTVKEVKGKWLRVSDGSAKGWIFLGNLTDTKPTVVAVAGDGSAPAHGDPGGPRHHRDGGPRRRSHQYGGQQQLARGGKFTATGGRLNTHHVCL